MKTISICADDYGLSFPISNGILKLVALGRLSATSCIVNSADWAQHANALRGAKIEVGLHFNLTEGLSLSVQRPFPSLKTIMLSALTRMLSREFIAAEFNAQLHTFCDTMQRPPDFIDGHQHVHHLPIIREVLFDYYRTQLSTTLPWLRMAKQTDGPNKFKTFIINHTGARYFRSQLRAKQIPHNSSFAGIYDFKHAVHYRQYCQQFLQQLTDGGLLMCHPGFADSNDPISAARTLEYQYFSSEHFIHDCAQHGITITPLSMNKS